MNIETAKRILTEKEPARLYEVVKPVLENDQLRLALVESSFARNERIRYNSARVLFRALEERPRLFYPYWARFAMMIDSPNGFHRSVAAQAIACLASVDVDCRLDTVLGQYLSLLDDDKVMVTHYFIESLEKVYRARPDLRRRVVTTLLGLDQTRHAPQRKDLLKADVIDIFDRLFDILPIEQRRSAIRFAQAALESRTSKTRKAATSFAAKHPG